MVKIPDFSSQIVQRRNRKEEKRMMNISSWQLASDDIKSTYGNL